MKYKVLSRSSCERYANQNHNDSSVVISIRSTWDNVLPNVTPNDKNNIRDVIYLAFNDVDIDMCIKSGNFNIGFITDDQANKIYNFCKKWYGKVDTFIFHCDGGISRSAGCCAAIMRWFEGYDYPIMRMKAKHPNMYCYTKVLDACRNVNCKCISFIQQEEQV